MVLDASFSRPSVAYLSDGQQVAAGVPRFEPGRFDKAIRTEEGMTNLIGTGAALDIDSNSDGIADGWVAYSTGSATGTRSIDTSVKTFGRVASQKIERTGGATSDRFGIRLDTIRTGAATPNINAVLIKVDSLDSGGEVRAYVDYYDSTGAWLQAKYTGLTSVTDWAWLVVPPSDNTSVAKFRLYIWIEGANGIIHVQLAQSENKAYRTSWHDSTRSPEILTIPAEVFVKGSWTKEFYFIPTSAQVVAGKTGYLWDLYIDANNYYALKVGPDGKPYLEVKSGGTVYQTSTASAPALTVDTPYAFAVRGNGSFMALFVNGSKISEVSYVEPVGTLPANQYLGCDHNGANHANGKFDSYRDSKIARADAEIAAASGQLPVFDLATTGLWRFDGNLRCSVEFGVPHDALAGYEFNTQFQTDITEFGDPGAEQRVAYWDTPRRMWTLSFRKDSPDTAAIVAFFEARRGKFESFDWVDPLGVLRRVRFVEDSLKGKVVGGISQIQLSLIEVLQEDTIPPQVVSVAPTNGGNSGSLTAPVTWTMSEAIRPSDVTETYFHVLDSTTGASVPGTLSYSGGGAVITFTPSSPWTSGRVYIARVEAGARDLAGNQLAVAYGSKFTATAS